MALPVQTFYGMLTDGISLHHLVLSFMKQWKVFPDELSGERPIQRRRERTDAYRLILFVNLLPLLTGQDYFTNTTTKISFSYHVMKVFVLLVLTLLV